jgi:hypothetical protein
MGGISPVIGQPDAERNLPRPALRYLQAGPRSDLEKWLDAWFAPKSFETTELDERLGVLIAKRFTPTGGDFGFASLVYALLILSPAMLQRYKRLRLYRATRHMAARQACGAERCS